MFDSFGDLLLQFARSADYLDDKSFDEIRASAEDYAKDTLKITSSRLMIAGRDEEFGRRMLYRQKNVEAGVYKSLRVFDDSGTCSGHCAYAFLENVPIWVVGKNGEPLKEAKSYFDLWSGRTDLPPYRAIFADGIRTSIIIPIEDQRHEVIGVLNFETTELVDITQAAKSEVKKIAAALGLCYLVFNAGRLQRHNTHAALKYLRFMQNRKWPKLTKPRVFLASSAACDSAVIDIVRKVFSDKTLQDKYELVHWEEMSRPGNINSQLLSVLSTCRYGICYFSERDPEHEGRFFDNVNVVFEAGMLHGRSDGNSAYPATWIPIREENSGPAPFDFSSERTILVPRKNGSVDGRKLAASLRVIVEAIDSEMAFEPFGH